MAKIFISYRRSDAGFPAGALGRDLRQHFGEAQVFRDQEDIEGGASWRERVLAEIGSDSTVLVLIGRRWLDVEPGQARPRVFEDDDPVRIEIIDGVKDGATIIPILLEDARMPAASALPEDLEWLSERNALKLRDGDWRNDVARICSTLEKFGHVRVARPEQSPLPAAPEPRVPQASWLSWKVATGLGLAVAAVAAVVGLRTPDSDAPTPVPVPREGMPVDVQRAYLELVRAFNAGDVSAYANSYVDPIECYYNVRGARASVVSDRARRGATLHVMPRDLMLLSSADAEVTFCDLGSVATGDGKVTNHKKTIVMRKQNGRWKVAIEVGVSGHACFPSRCANGQ